jgi:aminoglycoside phosphotransferase (APT) family kinase protein
VVVRVNALAEHVRDLGLGVDAWAMARLREAGLPWLPVHHVDVSRRLAPFEFEILDEAGGAELASLYDDEPRLRGLLGDLGALLARVHGIRVDGFGWVDVDPRSPAPGSEPGRGLFGSWREFVRTRLDEHLETCARLGVVTPAERRRIAALFDELGGLLDGVEPALLHGDLSGRNVFTDGRSVSALIDWEDCLAGDPAFDLAFWATFHPEERYPALLDGYASVRPLPPDFAARFWLYFLRVALSKTVQRHRFGYPDRLPGRPPASSRIQKAVARLDGAASPVD